MCVMKMGNIVPRVGIKPTSLAFWASVRHLHHMGSLMSLLNTRLSMQFLPCLRGQCRLLQLLIIIIISHLLLDAFEMYNFGTSEQCSGVGFVSMDCWHVSELWSFISQCLVQMCLGEKKKLRWAITD